MEYSQLSERGSPLEHKLNFSGSRRNVRRSVGLATVVIGLLALAVHSSSGRSGLHFDASTRLRTAYRTKTITGAKYRSFFLTILRGGCSDAMMVEAPTPALSAASGAETPAMTEMTEIIAASGAQTPAVTEKTEKLKRRDVESYWAMWVGGIGKDTTEKEILAAANPYAKNDDIISIRLIKKPKREHDLVFINFKNRDDAMKAYEGLKGTQLNGKTLDIRKPKERNADLKRKFTPRAILEDRRPNASVAMKTVYTYKKSILHPHPNRKIQNANTKQFLTAAHLEMEKIILPGNSTQKRPRINQTRVNELRENLERTPLALIRPWIAQPQDIYNYHIKNVQRPSKSFRSNLTQARKLGKTHVANLLQKGHMDNGIPWISYGGTEPWVIEATLKDALQNVYETQTQDKLLVQIGSGTTKAHVALEEGTLGTLERVSYYFKKPAVPLVPANMVNKTNIRPYSYLLTVKTKGKEDLNVPEIEQK